MKFDLWKEADAKATFTFALRPRLIQSGIGVKLLCCLSGKPQPTVQWFKDNKQISEADSHYSIECQYGVCTLDISACSMSDAGNYRCYAENSLGSDETSCRVTVEECKYKKLNDIINEKNNKNAASSQEPPVFERKLVAYKLVKAGDKVELRVTFRGNPAPAVHWFKNGEELAASSKMTIAKNENESILTLSGIQMMDEGEYSCKISNSRGMEVSKCDIELEKIRERHITPEKEIIQKKVTKKVTKKSEVEEIRTSSSSSIKTSSSVSSSSSTSITSSSSSSSSSSALSSSKKSQPKANFLKHIKSQNLNEGSPLILECEVSGQDSFEVTWLRNGKEIPENPDFLREKIDNLFKLTVSEIFPEDSGVFSAELFCKTTNETKLSSCSVIVKGNCRRTLFCKNLIIKFFMFAL